MIVLNEENHVYTDDSTGCVIPGVTSILAECGFSDGLKFVNGKLLEYKGDLGTEIHRVCYLYDQDRLVMDSVDLTVKPYLCAYIEFKADYGVNVLESEIIVHSKKHNFAGKIDIVAEIDGKRTIIDIKSGSSVPKCARLQTAGYFIAFNSERKMPEKAKKRLVVRLLPDATYKVEEYREKCDMSGFLACLSFLNTKRRYS